jgi:ABC-type Fe3+-hydroxamate transport system substrate-binding protein
MIRGASRVSGRGRSLVLAGLVLGAATACSGSEPGPVESTPASASATTSTATSTPTPAATTPLPPATSAPTAPTTRPEVADLRVSTSGLGPLAVGLPPATNPGVTMIEYRPTYCEDVGVEMNGSDPGRWIPAYEPVVGADGEPRGLFAVAADDAQVSWIDVISPDIPTTTGIHIGSTLEQLRAAYPDLVKGTEGPTSQVWWVADAAGTLVFETQDDSQGLQPAGTPPTVILVRVLAAGIDPDFTTANSGNVAGACAT